MSEWHCPVCGRPTRSSTTEYVDHYGGAYTTPDGVETIKHTHTHLDGSTCMQIEPTRSARWPQA